LCSALAVDYGDLEANTTVTRQYLQHSATPILRAHFSGGAPGPLPDAPSHMRSYRYIEAQRR
jgi:hypothetical protein